MSVTALKSQTPEGTYGRSRVRPTSDRVSPARPAPINGAMTQDGKYIP